MSLIKPNCTHTRPDDWNLETIETNFGPIEEWVNRGGQSTFTDINVGAFQCLQCGKIGYYTGYWKEYYENGIPCLGSESVDRSLVIDRLSKVSR